MSNLTLDLPTGNTGRDFETYYAHVTARSDGGRKIGHNTWAEPDTLLRNGEVRTCVHFRYHRTIIATWASNGYVQLDTGGWRTVTTKSRLNLIGRRLGFSVSQRAGVWYLYHWGSDREEVYFDGIGTIGHRHCAIGCECGAS